MADLYFTAQIMLLEKFLVLYKFNSDAYFYVLTGSDENELIGLSVLTALEETMANLLRSFSIGLLLYLPFSMISLYHMQESSGQTNARRQFGFVAASPGRNR